MLHVVLRVVSVISVCQCGVCMCVRMYEVRGGICWGLEAPSKIQEVTLMRPFHGNL